MACSRRTAVTLEYMENFIVYNHLKKEISVEFLSENENFL